MSEMVKAKLNGEFEIIIPQHRADRPEWYTPDGWEKKRLKALHKAIKNGRDEVVYYVGAEEGEMPALCQMWGAEVILFEPNPKVWSNTKAIWQANGLKDPFTFQGFCSNETRIIDADNGFKHGFPACADDEIIAAHGFKELYQEAQNYNQTKIDDIIIAFPTIITMDVEGSEFEVLKGAKETIRKHKPKIFLSLHPEFLFDQWGVYASEVRGWIKKLGYKEELLDYQHEVHLLYTPIGK